MQVSKIDIKASDARELYQEYKKHRHYEAPVDAEVQRAYQLLGQGKLIIRALDSITAAGLDNRGLPKLAIAEATAAKCNLIRRRDGSAAFWNADMGNIYQKTREARTFRFQKGSFAFPNDTFGTYTSGGKSYYRDASNHIALVPQIPKKLRPKRSLENYHILFEAEWSNKPPVDPYLLRRIGKADLWLVVAMWALTSVEQAALATRVLPQ